MRRMYGVKKNMERQYAEYKKSGTWLHNSVSYKQDRYLDDNNKALANKLFNTLHIKQGYEVEQKYQDFEILLANLFDQIKKPISISLSKNNWGQSRYSMTSYFTITLVYKLYNAKFIEMKKGYDTERESRMTRIWATEKLLDYFPEFATCVLSKPIELVHLKDAKGKLQEYKDTAETWRIRTILKRINKVNSKADIKYLQYKLHANLIAIFRERFTWYGRLHTTGFRHYQGFDKLERAEFTINGDNIVELDYSGLQPNLLYASEGIQYFGDPYSVIDNRREIRPFLKQVLLRMINAKNETAAERSAKNWFYEKHEDEELEMIKRIIKLIDIDGTAVRTIMDKFFEAHKPIAHYFCHGKVTGMKLMNKDAKIALDIINHFAKKNVPILCVHDSFIVQKQYEEELNLVMKNTYKRHTGFRINVKKEIG